ncbi:MAG: hypothetical protein ACXVAZ_14510, partial [Mucilaginibacter sp.]
PHTGAIRRCGRQLLVLSDRKLQIPVFAIFDPITQAVVGHTGGSPQCVDCTLQGTNQTPPFWQFTHQ